MLKPEMYATAQITVEQRRALAIPRNAILPLGEQTVVLGARAEFAGDPEPLPRLSELVAARDRLTFSFMTASLGGHWSAPCR